MNTLYETLGQLRVIVCRHKLFDPRLQYPPEPHFPKRACSLNAEFTAYACFWWKVLTSWCTQVILLGIPRPGHTGVPNHRDLQ
jgi:hypothetical protein